MIMDFASTLSEVRRLSVDDRLRLVDAIWESIAAEPDQVSLSSAQKQELDRRLAGHLALPNEGIPWEQVKQHALKRRRQ